MAKYHGIAVFSPVMNGRLNVNKYIFFVTVTCMAERNESTV